MTATQATLTQTAPATEATDTAVELEQLSDEAPATVTTDLETPPTDEIISEEIVEETIEALDSQGTTAAPDDSRPKHWFEPIVEIRARVGELGLKEGKPGEDPGVKFSLVTDYEDDLAKLFLRIRQRQEYVITFHVKQPHLPYREPEPIPSEQSSLFDAANPLDLSDEEREVVEAAAALENIDLHGTAAETAQVAAGEDDQG